MRATVSRWGHSLAVRLPKAIVEEAGLGEGAPVDLDVINGMVTLTPTRKRFDLGELIKGHRGAVTGPSAEVDWGEPVGEEKW
jgi:antitoxin MazE